MFNVLVMLFDVESEGYQAFTELKNRPRAEKYLVSEAALIKKEAGGYKVIDSFDSGAHTVDDTLLGGMLGMCIGVLGGPIGMMLGASMGSMIGLTTDTLDTIDGVSILEQIISKLDDDDLALIAFANEESDEALDAELSKYQATIARFDAAVVAQEVERAREMQAEMERLARAELRKQKSDEFKEKVEIQRIKMKGRFESIKQSFKD